MNPFAILEENHSHRANKATVTTVALITSNHKFEDLWARIAQSFIRDLLTDLSNYDSSKSTLNESLFVNEKCQACNDLIDDEVPVEWLDDYLALLSENYFVNDSPQVADCDIRRETYMRVEKELSKRNKALKNDGWSVLEHKVRTHKEKLRTYLTHSFLISEYCKLMDKSNSTREQLREKESSWSKLACRGYVRQAREEEFTEAPLLREKIFYQAKLIKAYREIIAHILGGCQLDNNGDLPLVVCDPGYFNNITLGVFHHSSKVTSVKPNSL